MEPNLSFCLEQRYKNFSTAIVLGSSTGLFSALSCLLAIVTLFYYKLHFSFNYRCILYLLLAHASYSAFLFLQLPTVWYKVGNGFMHIYCETVGFGVTYTGWVCILLASLMVAEIFFMAVFFAELQNWERVYIVFCIVFPLLFCWVPLQNSSYGPESLGCWIHVYTDDCKESKVSIVEKFALWFVPLCAISSIGILTIFISVSTLLCRIQQHKYRNSLTISSNDESQPLLINNKYKKALKEIAPLLTYLSIMVLLQLLAIIYLIASQFLDTLVSSTFLIWCQAIISHSAGFFIAIAFVIHLLILGKKKRRRLRPRSQREAVVRDRHPTQLPSCVNEGAEYTAAGSITVTHPTEFEPSTESEVDSSY